VIRFEATELIVLGVTIGLALFVFRRLNARANRDSNPPTDRRRGRH